LALLMAGEALILLRSRPVSDFYFPFVWLGVILFLDATAAAQSGRSLATTQRARFLLMFPLSIGFWWLFELFNVAVHNWTYVGTQPYQGLSYVAFASFDFSFVLPAVWEAADIVRLLLPAERRISLDRAPPRRVLGAMFAAGMAAIILPVLFPTVAFGLIWMSLFLLLDPVNAVLGRPSVSRAVWNGDWFFPLSLALGTLLCGFLWESWNFWSMPKWVYHIPHVGFWHVFAMPLLGWTGYLPFGLELFAMTNFVLPFLGLGTMNLRGRQDDEPPVVVRQAVS
jgi:hypothetical protein